MTRYIHGTHREEQDRLAKLNHLLNTRSLSKIHLTGNEKILDIGSGLGIFSRMLARRVNEGIVIGVEKSPEQLLTCRQLAEEDGESSLVDFRDGSAYDLPLKDLEYGTFDIVFIRFLLEHLDKPARVLEEAFRVLKSGGKIYLIDDDHGNFRISPHNRGFEKLWPAYCRVYQQAGNDPFIGRRFVTLLYEAGFRNNEIDFILFGAAKDQENFDLYADNLLGIIGEARTEICNLLAVDYDIFDKQMRKIEHWRDLPDAALWYVANWAVGIKR